VVCIEYDIDLHLLQASYEVIGDDDTKLCSNQLPVNFPYLFYIPVLKKCVNSFFPLYIDVLPCV
jgi:hypothetical protein